MAPTDATVLVTGESGTGKELVARAVHARSRRRFHPLVVIHCGALTETLLESELFGHEKGAFTGAHYRRKGKFEMADGGTLFLDEIGNIAMKTQMDLLRVLETKSFTRLGGNEVVHADFRVICATNRNLEEAAAAGEFREELYYRINVFSIQLPPVRDRKSDIPLLVDHFVQKFALAMGKPVREVSPEGLDLLMRYSWPGNVRELENVVHRAVLMCDGPTIGCGDLVPAPAASAEAASSRDYRSAKTRALEEFHRRFLSELVRAAGGNLSSAARLCGADRRVLGRLMRRYHIDPARFRAV